MNSMDVIRIARRGGHNSEAASESLRVVMSAAPRRSEDRPETPTMIIATKSTDRNTSKNRREEADDQREEPPDPGVEGRDDEGSVL